MSKRTLSVMRLDIIFVVRMKECILFQILLIIEKTRVSLLWNGDLSRRLRARTCLCQMWDLIKFDPHSDPLFSVSLWAVGACAVELIQQRSSNVFSMSVHLSLCGKTCKSLTRARLTVLTICWTFSLNLLQTRRGKHQKSKNKEPFL